MLYKDALTTLFMALFSISLSDTRVPQESKRQAASKAFEELRREHQAADEENRAARERIAKVRIFEPEYLKNISK